MSGDVKNVDVMVLDDDVDLLTSVAELLADVERSTQLRALGLKVFEFMRKPVQPQELLNTVERALQHSAKAA